MSLIGRTPASAHGILKAGAVLGLCAGLVGPVRAADGDFSQAVVTVDLSDTDLTAAVNLLKSQAGAQIVITPSDKPYHTVTLSLHDKPLDKVLRMIAQAAGASVKLDDGVYVIGPKEAAAVPDVPVVVDAGNRALVEPAQPVLPQEPKIGRKIQLRNGCASQIRQVLLYGDSGYANAMLQQQMMEERANEQSHPMRAVKQGTQIYGMGFNNSNTPQVPAGVPTNGLTSTAIGGINRADDGSEQFFGGGMGGYGGGGMGGGMGGFGGMGGGMGGRFNQTGSGTGTNGNTNGGNSNLLPEGMTGNDIVAYDLDNSLIVRATGPQFDELQRMINFLDIAPRQVMIRAEFISVSSTDLRTFGVNWELGRGGLQMGNTGSTDEPFASGDSFINYASGNLVAQLRASIKTVNGRIINAPMATTTNNVQVQFQSSTTVPVITTGVLLGGNGQAVTVPSIEELDITTGLSVLPRINGDDSITMTIMPQISDQNGSVSNPNGGTIPIIVQQYITVTRRIQNRETMVIGGLIRKSDSTTDRRVPILGDLPIIGSLFRARNLSLNDTELLIFVTPTIIGDRPGITGEGGVGATAGAGNPTP